MTDLLDVIHVTPEPGYRLLLAFENGERRRFDMSGLLDKKPFDRIRDPAVFNRASVDYGTVVWPGEIDIAPETLYDLSRPVKTALAGTR